MDPQRQDAVLPLFTAECAVVVHSRPTLELMEPSALLGRQLNAVWLSHPRIQPHPAWVDETTPDIHTLFVNLACAEKRVICVMPCEVEDPGHYPALGIELREVADPPNQGQWYEGTPTPAEVLVELAPHLPAAIAEVRLWDALGEGPDSALDIVLDNGVKLTVRHIMPPMILGVEVFGTAEGGAT